MTNRNHTIAVAALGRTPYRECWDLQHALLDRRSAGGIDDTLLLTEHDPVYTLGRGGNPGHLLLPHDQLPASGAEFVLTDRGGDITYHGPGQLVAYPILDLNNYGRDLHRYLRCLEEVVIRVLGRFDVHGSRVNGYTGVWVHDEKICAIGVRTSRWITMHGLALNVSTDLSFFDNIIPCGISDKRVTSLNAATGTNLSPDQIISEFIEEFGEVFDAAMIGPRDSRAAAWKVPVADILTRSEVMDANG